MNENKEKKGLEPRDSVPDPFSAGSWPRHMGMPGPIPVSDPSQPAKIALFLVGLAFALVFGLRVVSLLAEAVELLRQILEKIQ